MVGEGLYGGGSGGGLCCNLNQKTKSQCPLFGRPYVNAAGRK